MKLKPIVACDIDNTVSNQKVRFEKYYDSFKKILPPFVYEGELCLGDDPIEGAQKAIQTLSTYYRIVWVSARKQAQFYCTWEWLNYWKFPMDAIHLVEQNDNKIVVLEKMKPFVFIDDMKYNWEHLDPKPCTNFMKALDDKGINYEVFDNNWNELTKKYLKGY